MVIRSPINRHEHFLVLALVRAALGRHDQMLGLRIVVGRTSDRCLRFACCPPAYIVFVQLTIDTIDPLPRRGMHSAGTAQSQVGASCHYRTHIRWDASHPHYRFSLSDISRVHCICLGEVL